LSLRTEPTGAVWSRLYPSIHPNPLGFALGLSRFSDPTGTRFGVIYLGSTIKVAFAEVVLRDRGAASLDPLTVPFDELEALTCARIRVAADLRLIDLTGDGCLRSRVPTDVIGARDQTLSRVWAAALFDHETMPDGILYPSRLNEQPNVALHARAIGKLTPLAAQRLTDLRDELAEIFESFRLEVV
jgi:hypothetical protein